MDLSRSSSECSTRDEATKRNDKKRERVTDNSDKDAGRFKLPDLIMETAWLLD